MSIIDEIRNPLKGHAVTMTESTRQAILYWKNLAEKAADQIEQQQAVIDDFQHVMNGFLRAYPESIFPEPSKEQYEQANEILKQITPTFGTRLHGSWGRHISKKIAEKLNIEESLSNLQELNNGSE